MIKILLKILIIMLISLILLTLLSRHLDEIFTEEFVGTKAFWVMNHHDHNLDFAVIGSSRAENSVDIKTIEATTGKKGINLGVAGTGYAGNYIMLYNFIKNNNKIKLLLIQVDEYGFDSNNSYSNPFQVYSYLPFFSDKEISDVIKDNIDYKKYIIWQYLGFSRYAEFNSRYATYYINNLLSRSEFDYEKTSGTGYIAADMKQIFKDDKVTEKHIDFKDVKYLNKIIAYSIKNDIRVLLFTAPQYYERLKYLNTREEFLKIIHKISQEYNIGYVNYESDIISKDRGYFHDYTHLNSKGSVLFSTKLSSFVK